MHTSIFIFILSLGFVFSAVSENPFSDEFIDKINERAKTWTAGRNFEADTPVSQIKARLGKLPRHKRTLQNVKMTVADDLPESFDARDQWPDCTSIGDVRDQSTCASSWAFGAVEAMSDRICIHSNATIQVSISANDLLACCGYLCGEGCDGGYAEDAWSYWVDEGIVSGGEYGTSDGCQSYVFSPCDHTSEDSDCDSNESTPSCTQKCDANSTLTYENDLYYGEESYSVAARVLYIQSEIYTSGPVQASFDVFEDFYDYESGVYEYDYGGYQGTHHVKIIGWGVENDVEYWLTVNSWNESWGENGFFRILRGSDECGIESGVVAGIPKL